MKENSMNEEEIEKLKDLKAVYSGAIQSGEIGIANMIKGGIDLIEKLQKENEELKFEERRRIIGKYGDSEIHDVINRTLSNDYIPVQKVKDKIEHYQKLQDNYIEKYDEINEGLQAMINTLQELLEGRK